MAAENLKEGIERGGGVVVVLVEGRGSGFDTLGVGWKMLVEVYGTAGLGNVRSMRPSSSWTNCCSSMAMLPQCSYVKSKALVVYRRTTKTFNSDSCEKSAGCLHKVGTGTFSKKRAPPEGASLRTALVSGSRTDQ